MKKIFLLGLFALLLTGCNYQPFEMQYTFEKAICKIGNEFQEIQIKNWTDYEGEQIQIIDFEDNVYLVSSINCTLIKKGESK